MGVFVQVISERSETAALVITTNLPFSEWTQVFANARLCKALGDDSYGIPVYDTTRTALGELLYRLKYRGDQSALASIVDSVLAFLGQWKPPADLIVPVPPSNAAGKNQPVILIARELERLSDTELCNGCVVKSTPTEQLKNVHVYDERVKILRNAFTVGRAKVEDRKVLLLDDLFRSGATLSAVTEALYNVGVEEVYALTITNEASIVNSVFIGGSRKLTRLTEVVHRRLENIIQKNLRVLVGDANGTDKAIQKFFFDRSYENVIVYCMKGGCRNNLGSWEKREISSDGQERGWRYYALKDTAMATDASCGFMTWDGRSKGTLNNVLNLLQDGKVSVLYFSLEKLFFTIRSPQEVRDVLAKCSPNMVDELAIQLDLERRLASAQRVLPLADEAETHAVASSDR